MINSKNKWGGKDRILYALSNEIWRFILKMHELY